jgi:hypothetical protein
MVITASAQINQATFTYPLGELTVDNTFGDWGTSVSGQMFAIGTTPGGTDVTYGVLRRTPTSTKLYLDAKSQGDPGYARDIHQPLANDQYITVFKYRPPWGLLSSIRGGVFYKQWDVPYAGQGANPEPIVRMGEWRQGFVDETTGLLRLPFTVDPYLWNKSLSSILWTVDGGTIAVGDDDDATIEVDFEPGFYEVRCRVIDNKGKVRTGYRYVWANTSDPDDVDAPFSYAHDVRITTDRRDPFGRTMTLEVDGQLEQDELFPGQAFLLTEYSTFDGETLDNDSHLVKSFVGYSTELGIKSNWRGKTTTISLASPTTVSKLVPTASQQITESRTPKNWSECTSLLSNAVGAAWYIAVYHSPFLVDGHDFTFDPYLLLMRRKMHVFQQRDIGSQLQSLNLLMRGNIGCKSSGLIRMVRNPNDLQNDDRDLLEELWTIEPTDVIGEITIPVNYRNSVGQVSGFAYSYNGGSESTPYASLAPGYAQAQGSEQDQMTAFTVIHGTDSQQRVNEITGHQFAADNPKHPNISIRIDRNIDIFEPCDQDAWTILDIPADYDPLNVGWPDKRMIPVAVTTSWSFDRGTVVKEMTVEFQFQSYGVPGVTVPVNRGGANNWLFTKWNPGVYDPYKVRFPDMDVDLSFLVAWNSDGKLGRTLNPLDDNVIWSRLTGITGRVRDFCFNWHSAYFTDPTDPLRAWVIADDGLTIRIYYTFDLLVDKPTWEVQATFTAADTYKGRARIVGSKEESGFAIAAWKTAKGVTYTRTTNTGTTWSGVGSLLQTFDDPDRDNNYLGLAVYDETQAILAPDGNVNALDGKYDWKLYVATTKGGAFSLIANEEADERCIPDCVLLVDDTEGFVGTEVPEPPDPPTPLSIVTFGVGGYPNFSINGAGTTAGLGNPQPAAYSSANLSGGAVQVGVTVEVDLDADYIFASAVWDAFPDGDVFVGSDIFDATYRSTIRAYDVDGVLVGEYIEENTTGFIREIDADILEVTEPVRELHIGHSLSWLSDSGSGIAYVWIDNIDITATQITRQYKRTFKHFTTAGAWDDRSPNDVVLPAQHYGAGNFAGSNTSLSILGADEDGYVYLLNTGTGGASWSRVGRSPAAGLKKGSGGVLILFGYGNLGISDDSGRNVYSRLGNWSTKVGDVAKIEGVAGVL